MNEDKMKLVGVDLLERVYGKWWLMLLDGLILIALCVMSFVIGKLTPEIFVYVLGVYRGIMGIAYIISSLIAKKKYGSSISFSLGHGLFDLVICAVFLLVPKFIASFFIIIIGIWAIMTGIFLLIISGSTYGLGKSTKVVIGIGLIAFGIYAFFDPLSLATIFIWIIGLVLGIFGLFLVIQSIKMKKVYAKIKLENKGYDDYRIE
ncbi:DUF308 domain-containing protein [Acetobacterium sp.]|uniref:DUF308 domain-containing protein n=1 Tax=Acetobacterium sp. TaxID=1872094 RepID=UPI002F3F6F1D